jgi:hypothetical protein
VGTGRITRETARKMDDFVKNAGKDKKRKPLMIDRWLASSKDTAVIERRVLGLVTNKIVTAKRFVFNDDAVDKMASVIREIPEAIAEAQQFAIPCFENMYVELDYTRLYQALTWDDPTALPGSDVTVGFLFVGPHVYGFFEGLYDPADGIENGLLPIRYRMNRPFTVEEEQLWCEEFKIPRIQLDAFMWGSTYRRIDDSFRRTFRANHSWEWVANEKVTNPDTIASMLKACAGDIRNIITILLLLNQASGARYETIDVPHKQTVIKSKPRTMLSHSIVRISIDPKPHLRVLGGSHGGSWRREHDVRGHFCHDETSRNHHYGNAGGHVPDWTEYGPNQWRCLKCGGLRWWRKEHRRGHKEKGRVKESYEVTA